MTTAEIAELTARHYNATVTYLKKVNPDLAILRIQPDFPRAAAQARAVQHAGAGQLGAAHRGLSGGDSQAGRRQKADPPGLLDQLSRPGRRRQLLDPAQARIWLEFYIVLVREAEKGPPL